MREDIVRRVKAQMLRLGYNLTTLADEAEVGRTYVSDWFAGRSKSPGIDGFVKLCKVLGMSAAELLDGQVKPPIRVPIIGETTHIDKWRQYIFGKKLPDILDLWTTNDDLIAIRVAENSMAPRFQKGDVVLGNRIIGNNADNYIGLPCILKTQDDATFIKIITRGSRPGLYTLRSIDPMVPDIENVEFVWFAPIVSIQPQSA